MTKQPAIEVEHVSKSFKLPHEKHSSIKSALISRFKSGKGTYEKQDVLDDISFKIEQGDFFGIVGRNGNGKSTLLKMLAGIYPPNEGTITINGKLTPFIELGVGFNPELTGRENVFLNGALLGFNRQEMAAMYDDIVDFAELSRFMDQKLKNYSSGMQVRLAFSIAIRAKSDILLLDEVLAVGDEAFQQKCTDVFEAYKANKQTVVLVTHDMASVKRFCNKAMLINDGKIVKIGDPNVVADSYSKLNQVEIDRQTEREQAARESRAVETVPEAHIVEAPPKPKFLTAQICNTTLQKASSFDVGGSLIIRLGWNGLPATDMESVGVDIFRQSGEHVTGINSRSSSHGEQWKDAAAIDLHVQLNLAPGKYKILVTAFQKEGKPIDSILDGPTFNIRNTKMKWSGLTELAHSWQEGR